MAAAEYQADFLPSPKSTTPDRYMVVFHTNHTPEKHIEFVGQRYDTMIQGGSFSCTMTPEIFERARRDPGVKQIIQHTHTTSRDHAHHKSHIIPNIMSSSPTDNNAAANQERARLTEREKKQNHIVSEQKRRQAIRAGFDRLAAMVPGMQGQGRSEAVVLESAVKFDRLCTRRKRKLNKLLVSKIVTRSEFDAAYNPDSVGRAEHEAQLKGESTNNTTE